MADDFEARFERLAELKARFAALTRERETVGRELHEHQERLWADMEGRELKSARYDTSGQFSRKATIYAQITDKAAFLAWAEDNLPDELTRLDVPSSRLNELVRSRLDTEEDLPPGLSFYTKRYISHTKTKETRNGK